MTRVFDPYDPNQHKRAAKNSCREVGRRLRDKGYDTGEIVNDPTFKYWQEIAYTVEMMRRAHAREVVNGLFRERGRVLPHINYPYKEPVQTAFVIDGDGAGSSGQFVWRRATEERILANPLLQVEVIRSRIDNLLVQLESLPRRGLQFRAVRREIGHLRDELKKLTI